RRLARPPPRPSPPPLPPLPPSPPPRSPDLIRRRHHKGHVARTRPRQHVHHPVGRTGDHRRLHVVHRHRKTARGAVAAGIGRRARHRGRPHRKTAAAGRHAHHAHPRTIIRRRHHKGHVARTRLRHHAHHPVG